MPDCNNVYDVADEDKFMKSGFEKTALTVLREIDNTGILLVTRDDEGSEKCMEFQKG